MFFPRLDGCCGASLKTGATIVGVLELLFGCTALTFSTIMYENIYKPNKYPDLSTDDKSILFGLYVTVSAVTYFQIFFTCLMLFGIKRRKPGYVKLWILFSIINLIEMIVVIVLNTFVYSGSGKSVAWIVNITAGLFLVLKLYFIIVVYNYNFDLKTTTPTIQQPYLIPELTTSRVY